MDNLDRSTAHRIATRRPIGFFGGGDRLWDLLELHAKVVHEAAVAAASLRTASSHGAGDAAGNREPDGELLALEVETALRRMLVVPIDRQDLHELSSGLSTLHSVIGKASRDALLFGLDGADRPAVELEQLLVSCTTQIREGVGHLRRRDYIRVMGVVRELRTHQHRAEIVRVEVLSALLEDDAENDSRAARELIRSSARLEALDTAIRECGVMGKYLAYLAVKNT